MNKNVRLSHYINGEWRASTGDLFSSVNPANGQVIWQGNTATPPDITAAFNGACEALPLWKNMGVDARTSYLLEFAKQIDNNKSRLINMISMESGKPLWESSNEVNAVIAKINLSITAYQQRCAPIETHARDIRSFVRYKSHGVIAVLGPFNFPAHLSNSHIIPALLAGNTIIYKPSELTPGVAEIIMQCWHATGLPTGVIQCIQGGSDTARRLLQHDIQGVFFTGSYQTGVKINQQFSDRPEVILALEMGGNNPLIIDEISHIPAAVYHAVLSTMITAGQRCSCARRLIIPNTMIGDTFLQQFIESCTQLKIGPYQQTPQPFMGPVIRYEHALSHLNKQQALIKTGGQPLLTMSLLQANTGFLSPGIIDMTQASPIQDEEIFAPLVQIYRSDSFEQALTLANQTRFGLAAGLLSDNKEHYHHFFNTINAGIINWNKATTGASSALPFGGIGKSGNHRPSAYFAADYCAYPIASMEHSELTIPDELTPGITIID